MQSRAHVYAAKSDPERNTLFRRRWSPDRWEIDDLEERARRAERGGHTEIAAELAMRALRLRVAEVSR